VTRWIWIGLALALAFAPRQAAAQTSDAVPPPPVALEPPPESQPAPAEFGFENKTPEPAAPTGTTEHVPESAAATAPASGPVAGAKVTTSPLGPIVGGCVGCTVCGGLPDAVGIAATTMLLLTLEEAGRTSGCGGVILVILAAVYFGVPAVIASVIAGPLAPLAAMAGTAIGAAMAGRPFWVPLVGGLPGLLVGAAGSALIVASLTVLSERQTNPALAGLPANTTLLIAGIGLALAGGPIALVGTLGSDLLFGAMAGD